MLMPDRLPDQAASRENQAQFEALARHLLEEEIVSTIYAAPGRRVLTLSVVCRRRSQ